MFNLLKSNTNKPYSNIIFKSINKKYPNSHDKLYLFIFKLNTDGDYNNIELVSNLCDKDEQIISGIFFEFNTKPEFHIKDTKWDSQINEREELITSTEGINSQLYDKLLNLNEEYQRKYNDMYTTEEIDELNKVIKDLNNKKESIYIDIENIKSSISTNSGNNSILLKYRNWIKQLDETINNKNDILTTKIEKIKTELQSLSDNIENSKMELKKNERYINELKFPERFKEFYKELNELQSIKKHNSINEQEQNKNNQNALIYKGIQNGIISCNRAQLHLDIKNFSNISKLVFDNEDYYNMQVTNYDMRYLFDSHTLEKKSHHFNTLLDFIRSNSIFNIYFCEEISSFNKYIQDISTLEIKSKHFISTIGGGLKKHKRSKRTDKKTIKKRTIKRF
jgi:hypothetical protein